MCSALRFIFGDKKMIGKILYKAKVKDNKVVIESHTIVTTERKYHYFGGKLRCLKSDVGVVCFLTKIEAINYLIKKIEASIDMGEKYVRKEKRLFSNARQMLVDTTELESK